MTTTTFPISGGINLLARLGHGSINVHCVDELTEARVDLAGGGTVLERTTVEMQGPTLTIGTPRQGGLADLFGSWRRNLERLDVVVQVPTGTAVKIITFTADITVEGRCGGADLASGHATVRLGEVGGDLLVRSGSSSVTAGRVAGNATIRTGNGDVRIGEIRGDVQSMCGSGRLDVGLARGSVRLRSGSGEVSVGAAFGDVDLGSGSGSMSIGLPEGVRARLDVTAGSGQVLSELPITDRADRSGPAISVRARTGSGDVRLFRAVA